MTMFAHNFIYILSGVVISLILCISEANGITNESSNQCAQYNHEFCVSDEDCIEITHAKCSTEKKCVCRAKNLRLNETYCAPILGGFCWKNETCVTRNALCIKNQCRCKKNYSVSEDQCLPVFIGSHCSYDRDCAKIKFAKCSENNYCDCSLNTVVIENNSCGSVLDSYCATDSDCLGTNLVCKNNKCQCRPEYVAINRNQCIRPNSGISCTNDDFCKVFMNNAICAENNTCISNQDIDQVNQETYVSLDTIDKCRV
ncbi:sortilin-related receptor-like [Cotesia glomerata]|uniref:sortilin-related receptor-like n=1 Tax=Cotesia glomerata TaxID=32391 RepID=UPI001D00EB32|nr:sortilin-related receptor-like [Cotesia glomerata]